ncbi:MAG: hypothetical protein L0229_05345 [Blastocatellia bacterium]|nr:hypothetical protein [Blastocatellia bacterium]
MSLHSQNRTLQISDIPPDKMDALIERANESGMTPEEYALRLIVEALSPREKTFDEILAPFRGEVKESGIREDHLDELFMKARRDYAREQKEKD